MTQLRERFINAALIEDFEPDIKNSGCFIAWSVSHVRGGQRFEVSGPFFTEEEALISADLLKEKFKGARSYKSSWGQRELIQQLSDNCRASRLLLAQQLGISLSASCGTA